MVIFFSLILSLPLGVLMWRRESFQMKKFASFSLSFSLFLELDSVGGVHSPDIIMSSSSCELWCVSSRSLSLSLSRSLWFRIEGSQCLSSLPPRACLCREERKLLATEKRKKKIPSLTLSFILSFFFPSSFFFLSFFSLFHSFFSVLCRSELSGGLCYFCGERMTSSLLCLLVLLFFFLWCLTPRLLLFLAVRILS